MRSKSLISVIIAVLLVISVASITFAVRQTVSASPETPNIDVAPTPAEATVMAIGGSVAYGWDDKGHGGYLTRTFDALSATTNATYNLVNKAIIGANAVQLQDTLYKGRYSQWLQTYTPNIVVISWGLLNDCLPNTPMDEFDKYLTEEIDKALAQNAVVYVVSPPVTAASYTKYKTQEQAYVNEEQTVVDNLNNPNVYFFDVFDQMKQYLASANQSVSEFGNNAWHPNSMGHVLAANILVQDIQNATGNSVPKFQPTVQ